MDRKPREDLPPLRNEHKSLPYTLRCGGIGYICPLEKDGPLPRRLYTREAHEERCLSRAVCPDDTHHLAGLYPKRNPSQRLDVAVTAPEGANFQKRCRTHEAVSAPRYASMTLGLARISAGIPSAILLP